MEIFGVGILEVILILVIAIIVLGPEGMVKTARSAGVWIRKIIKSPIWSQLMDTQRELRQMPTRLVREAGLEEDIKELKKTQQQLRNLDVTGGEFTRPVITTVPPGESDTKAPGETPSTQTSLVSDEVEPNAVPEVDEHTIAPPEIRQTGGSTGSSGTDDSQI